MSGKYTFVAMALNHFALLTIISLCCEGHFEAEIFNKEPELAGQMCAHDYVEFQTVTTSAMSCVRKCSERLGCRSLVYIPSNKTCFGIKTDYPFGVNTSLPGAVFYQSNNPHTMISTTSATSSTTTATTTATTTRITSTTSTPPTTTMEQGTPRAVGLPNSQFTASTSYSSSYAPWHARLNNTIKAPWEAGTQDKKQWLQIDFMSDITATHVITKGRHSETYPMWVTSYKVLTSSDCTNFVVVKDDLGNDKVFPGNTDQYTAVQHALVPQFVCRCFRVNPQTWQGSFIALRLEVLGHLM